MINPSKIRRARLLRDYSMKHMARGLAIDESTYGRLERGDIRLNEERIKQLTQVLDMSYFFIDHIEEIIGGLNTHLEHMPYSGSKLDEALVSLLSRIESHLQSQQQLVERWMLQSHLTEEKKDVGGNKN